MKSLITIFSLQLICFNSFAQGYLKSDSIRADICSELLDELEEVGIYEEYENHYGDKTAPLKGFKQHCSQSNKSFIVTKVTKPEVAKFISGLEVKIDYTFKNKLVFTGDIAYKRSAFDPHTGEPKKGDWISSAIKNSQLVLKKKIVAELAEALAGSANIHNGDADLSPFNVKKFNAKTVLKELKVEVQDNNQDSSCKMSEPGIVAVDDLEYIFENSDSYQALEILKLLKSQGHILEMFQSSTEDDSWEESCAYDDVYIYLTNGILISLNFDFTT